MATTPDISSPRPEKFLEVYKKMRKESPMEKIVIFSQYLRHLDIVSEALSRRYDITALRYDGTVPPSKREKV
jgi:SNF2 family DNA or RNA helicase